MKIKKIFRGLMTLGLSAVLMFSSSLSTVNASNKYKYRSIQDLDSLKFEDTLSYEEMLGYMKSNSYSQEEILDFQNENNQIIQESLAKNSSMKLNSTLAGTTIRFSTFAMKTFSYSFNFFQKCKVQARFSVGLEYDIGASSPNRIVSLGGEHAYTGAGDNCVFSGSIFYQLEAGNRFYYSMYGNLYEQGLVNWTVGGSIGVGGSATLNGSISNGSGFIKMISVSETYNSTGLDP